MAEYLEDDTLSPEEAVRLQAQREEALRVAQWSKDVYGFPAAGTLLANGGTVIASQEFDSGYRAMVVEREGRLYIINSGADGDALATSTIVTDEMLQEGQQDIQAVQAIIAANPDLNPQEVLQLRDALAFAAPYVQQAQASGQTLVFGGHSLGGALASAQAVYAQASGLGGTDAEQLQLYTLDSIQNDAMATAVARYYGLADPNQALYQLALQHGATNYFAQYQDGAQEAFRQALLLQQLMQDGQLDPNDYPEPDAIAKWENIDPLALLENPELMEEFLQDVQVVADALTTQGDQLNAERQAQVEALFGTTADRIGVDALVVGADHSIDSLIAGMQRQWGMGGEDIAVPDVTAPPANSASQGAAGAVQPTVPSLPLTREQVRFDMTIALLEQLNPPLLTSEELADYRQQMQEASVEAILSETSQQLVTLSMLADASAAPFAEGLSDELQQGRLESYARLMTQLPSEEAIDIELRRRQQAAAQPAVGAPTTINPDPDAPAVEEVLPAPTTVPDAPSTLDGPQTILESIRSTNALLASFDGPVALRPFATDAQIASWETLIAAGQTDAFYQQVAAQTAIWNYRANQFGDQTGLTKEWQEAAEIYRITYGDAAYNVSVMLDSAGFTLPAGDAVSALAIRNPAAFKEEMMHSLTFYKDMLTDWNYDEARYAGQVLTDAQLQMLAATPPEQFQAALMDVLANTQTASRDSLGENLEYALTYQSPIFEPTLAFAYDAIRRDAVTLGVGSLDFMPLSYTRGRNAQLTTELESFQQWIDIQTVGQNLQAFGVMDTVGYISTQTGVDSLEIERQLS